MERKAKFILTTQKTSLSETDFETVRAILEHAILRENENPDTTLERELEKIFSELDGENDTSELITEGVVREKESGGVVLEYNESELTGMEGCVTKIMFSKNKPGFVVMMREGMVNTSLSFETGKRHTSVYSTPYMPFRLCVNTLRVDNQFDTFGEIEIEYLLEIRGLSTERNILSIKTVFLD
ncbi:MAG: DUF1934 domain-containing protein [Ruminococcaceae bacterium]|nr:DUF1934 domain-containing protein [Oscillospiraceae bacterium]